jgi:hypothetical protein
MTIVCISQEEGTGLYRVADDRGWLEFEVSHSPENADRRIAAHYGRRYGGSEFASMTPGDFPDVFAGGIEAALLAGVKLPEFDPENTWASMRKEDSSV